MQNYDLRFREMNEGEFEKFLEASVLDYSRDLEKSGLSSKEKAFENSKKHFDELLPQGKYTDGNFIYIVVNSKKEDVGAIWYRRNNEKVAFICDFLIYDNFRKKGYGKRTLLLLDREAKERGYEKILLHVFKYNKTAFSLYESLGYKVVKEEGNSVYMVKEI